MKRRELLKTAGLTAAGLAFANIPKEVSADAELQSVARELHIDQMPKYRGFGLRWRGWFPISNMDVMCGQWIAYDPVKSLNVYSAYPGGVYKFYPGQLFDLSVREEQIPVPDLNATPEHLERCKQDAYKLLISFIDEHYEELTTK
jgi:hypothetical protein